MNLNKDKILEKLKKQGFVTDELVAHKLLSVFNQYMKMLVDDEVKLLEEFSKLHDKKNQNEKLTYLEETFYNFMTSKYKKD